MEQIFANQYVTFYHQVEKQLLIDAWHDESKQLAQEEFKKILIYWKDMVVKHQIKKSLTDAQKLHFVIDPTIQEWVANEVLSVAAKAGLLKMAFILPPSIFEKVSLQQTIDERDDATEILSRKYFENQATAEQWLFS